MTPRRTPGDEQIREAFGEVGDALQRAIVLSSDRVQSVLEDAVLRGRMTRRDAEELATNLVTLGREQALELRTHLAKSVGDTVASAGEAVANASGAVATAVTPPSKRRRSKASANGTKPTAKAEPKPATKPKASADDPAAKTAKELVDLTATLTTPELQTLREREAAGKGRATVLKAIDRKLDR